MTTMASAAGMPYTEDLSFQEALTTYLDSIKPPVTGLESMLDQKDPEGCTLLEMLLNIQAETTKAINWYQGDDRA